MVIQYNIADAKTHLSRILETVTAGEEVVVARAGKPLAKLVPFEPAPDRQLGFMPLEMPDERFRPLDPDELDIWK